MKPIKTKDTNAVFQLQGGTKENDLPVNRTTIDGRSVLVSYWKLADHEVEAIKNGATVELVVWGGSHPPVSLGIGEAE